MNLLKRKRNKLLITQQTKRKGNLKIFSHVWCSYGENIFHAAKTKTVKTRLFVCGSALSSVFLLLLGNETLLWRLWRKMTRVNWQNARAQTSSSKRYRASKPARVNDMQLHGCVSLLYNLVPLSSKTGAVIISHSNQRFAWSLWCRPRFHLGVSIFAS